MTDSAKADLFLGSTQFTAEEVAEFCLASGDSNPLHVNPAAARRAGLPSCIVPGGMIVFFLERAIMSKSPRTTLIEVRARFTAPLLIDSTVHCEGRFIPRGSPPRHEIEHLMRIFCRDETRRILCVCDAVFSPKD